MTSDEVRSMKDNEFLDMDYFFHKFDDTNNDDFCKKEQFPIIKKVQNKSNICPVLYMFSILFVQKIILYLPFLSP